MSKYIKIVDHPKQWFVEFCDGWLQHYKETGAIDWGLYNYLKNDFPPFGKGIAKEDTRLMLISVAGGYDSSIQNPFEESVIPGDLSVRRLPHPIADNTISFSNSNYPLINSTMLQKAFFPVGLLKEISDEGDFQELVNESISINGEIANVLRVEKELLPKVMELIEKNNATATLLIPSSDLSVQTAMLLARGLELCQIPSVLIGINYSYYEKILPPRIVFIEMEDENDRLNHINQQLYKSILKQAIACLAMNAPVLVEKK